MLTFTIQTLIIHARGEVLELADRHDLGSCAETREGSSPSFPTSKYESNIEVDFENN